MASRSPGRPDPSTQGGLSGPLLERLREAVRFPGEPHPDESAGRRHAGVLLLFDPASEGLPLLFTLRSADLRFHAGQIAFPGGTSEEGDADIVATALREADEEVGVAPANVDVIGVLPPLVTAMSDRWLTPVVGLQCNPFDVVSDPSEVAEWFHVDLATLLTAPHEVRELVRSGLSRDVHYYHAGSRVIWGVTAAILHELLTRLGRDD